jgi:quercetin dioxygenase-like cupin family protein
MKWLIIFLLVSCAAAQDVPKNWFAIPPDQLRWTKMSDGTGRDTAVLFGDRRKPELYGYLVKWPPNTHAKAHSHPDSRYVYVLSGVFYHGHGTKFDVNKLERRSTGTLFSEPAGVAHFGATKAEGAVLYFVGIGPNRTDQIEK